MRIATVVRSTALGLALAAALSPVRTARADEEFDVTVTAGKVEVKTKGDWHINKDYPWKLTVGDTKLDKSKFTLEEKSASVSAPKGKAHLRGGVCSGEQCRMFQKDLDVP